jgi:endoglucanase
MPVRAPFKTLLLTAILVVMAAFAAPAMSTTRANPFRGARLHVDPNSAAARQVREWRVVRPLDALLLEKIARTPSAEWLGGWYPHVGSYVRSEIARQLRPAHETAFYALYDLPERDCSGYSAGGLSSGAQYRRWVDEIARAIGSYPAVVLVEPDALPEVGCLSRARRAERIALERYATRRLGSLRRTSVYIDAGSYNFNQAHQIAGLLRQAGVRWARGFALGTTSYDRTSDNLRYGHRIARALDGKHFIVNTSRNGRGPLPSSAARTAEDFWCNPLGRGLGSRPTTSTGDRLADAYEWTSHPGYSDGPCHGGPPSGEFWPDYALTLARNAVF